MEIELTQSSFDAVPGTPVLGTVVVTNVSGRTSTGTMRVVGAPTVDAGVSGIRLEPGASERIEIPITMPLGSPAGIHPFHIEVASDDGTVRRAQGEIQIRDAGFVHIGLSPSGIDDYWVGKIRTSIYNHGRTPVSLELSGEGDDHPMRFRFKPRRITVMPGERVRIPTRISSRQPLFGDPVVRGFTVRAHGASVPLHVRGTFRQHAVLSRTTSRISSVLAILLAFALFAVLVLIPRAEQQSADRRTDDSTETDGSGGDGSGAPGSDGSGADGEGTGAGQDGTGTDGSGEDGVGQDGDGAGADGDAGADGAGTDDETAIPATTTTVPAGTPRVTGFVRGEDNSGLSGVVVNVRPANERTTDATVAVERAIQPLHGKRLGPLPVDPRRTVTIAQTSGDDGSYTVTPLEPGAYTATYTHPVYETAERLFVISPDRDPVALDVPMEPAKGSIAGIVRTDPPGQVASIVVTDGTTTYKTRTTPDGAWTIARASTGTYVVTASVPSGESAATRVAVGQGRAVADDLSIRNGFASLSGRVCNAGEGGGGVAGATVEVVIDGSDDRFSVTTRDAAEPSDALLDTQIGTFTIDGLPVQPQYTVVVAADGFASSTQELRPGAVANACITVSRTTGGVSGTVAVVTASGTDDSSTCVDGGAPDPGDPAARIKPTGITVELISDGQTFKTTVGDDGAYAMSGIPAGEYSVKFSGNQARTGVCRVVVIAPNVPVLGMRLIADTRAAERATTLVDLVIPDALKSAVDTTLVDLDVSIPDHIDRVRLENNKTPTPSDPISLPIGRHVVRMSAQGHETVRVPFTVTELSTTPTFVDLYDQQRPGAPVGVDFDGELRPLATVDTTISSGGALFPTGDPAPGFVFDASIEKRSPTTGAPNGGLDEYATGAADETDTRIDRRGITELNLPRRLPTGTYHLDVTRAFHYPASIDFEIDLKDTTKGFSDFTQDVELARFPRTQLRVVEPAPGTGIAPRDELDSVVAVIRSFDVNSQSAALQLCATAPGAVAVGTEDADSLDIAGALTVRYDTPRGWDGTISAHSTDIARGEATPPASLAGWVVVCRSAGLDSVAVPLTLAPNDATVVSVPINPATRVQLEWDDFGTTRFDHLDQFTVLIRQAGFIFEVPQRLTSAGDGVYQTSKIAPGTPYEIAVLSPDSGATPGFVAPALPIVFPSGTTKRVTLATNALTIGGFVRTTGNPSAFTIDLTPRPDPGISPAPAVPATVSVAIDPARCGPVGGVTECRFDITAPQRGTYRLSAVGTDAAKRAVSSATAGTLLVTPDRAFPAEADRPLLVIARKQADIRLTDTTTNAVVPAVTGQPLRVVVTQDEGGTGVVPQGIDWDGNTASFLVDPTNIPAQIATLRAGVTPRLPSQTVVPLQATAFDPTPPVSGPVTVTVVDPQRQCRSRSDTTRRDVCDDTGAFTDDPRFGFLGADIVLDGALGGAAANVPADVPLVPYTDLDVQVFGNAGGAATLEAGATVTLTVTPPIGFTPSGRYLDATGAWQAIPFTAGVAPTFVATFVTAGATDNANLRLRGISFVNAGASCGECFATFDFGVTHPGYEDNPTQTLAGIAQGTKRVATKVRLDLVTPRRVLYRARFEAETRGVFDTFACITFTPTASPTSFPTVAYELDLRTRPQAEPAPVELQPRVEYRRKVTFLKCDGTGVGGGTTPGRYIPPTDIAALRYELGVPRVDELILVTPKGAQVSGQVNATHGGTDLAFGGVPADCPTDRCVRVRLYSVAELSAAGFTDLAAITTLPSAEPAGVAPLGSAVTDASGAFTITDSAGTRVLPTDAGAAQNYVLRVTSSDLRSKWHAIGALEENAVKTLTTPLKNALRTVPATLTTVDLDGGDLDNFGLRLARAPADILDVFAATAVLCPGSGGKNTCSPPGLLPGTYAITPSDTSGTAVVTAATSTLTIPPLALDVETAATPATKTVRIGYKVDRTVRVEDGNTRIDGATVTLTEVVGSGTPNVVSCTTPAPTPTPKGECVLTGITVRAPGNPGTTHTVAVTGIDGYELKTADFKIKNTKTGSVLEVDVESRNRTLVVSSGATPLNGAKITLTEVTAGTPTILSCTTTSGGTDGGCEIKNIEVRGAGPTTYTVSLTGVEGYAITGVAVGGGASALPAEFVIPYEVQNTFLRINVAPRDRAVTVKDGATDIDGATVTLTELPGEVPGGGTAFTASCGPTAAGTCTLQKVKVRGAGPTTYSVAVTGIDGYVVSAPNYTVTSALTGDSLAVTATPRSQTLLLTGPDDKPVNDTTLQLASPTMSCPATGNSCSISLIAPGSYTATAKDGTESFTVTDGGSVVVGTGQPAAHTMKVSGFLTVSALKAGTNAGNGTAVVVTEGGNPVGNCNSGASTTCRVNLSTDAGATDSLTITATFTPSGGGATVTSTKPNVTWQTTRSHVMGAFS